MRDRISMYILKGDKCYQLNPGSVITCKQNVSADFFQTPTFEVFLKWNKK
jgi:hypothetical protein